jgi:hypothetical protein
MNRDFKGAARRFDDVDLPKLGARMGVGEDEVHAFIDVETRGHGFDDKGRPIILFERHIFYRELSGTKRDRAVKEGLASKTPGGYGKYSEQYGKLFRALDIDEDAALKSCSWGLGQVMGFNYESAGYASVQQFVEAMMDDEESQLAASVDFILANHLDDELRNHDWAGFAKGYNGSNYRKNRYDEKLAEAFAKWSRIKDTPWSPEAPQEAPQAPGPAQAPSAPKQPPSLLAALLSTIVAAWKAYAERKRT